MNLNGPWAFAFDPDDAGVREGWFKPDAPAFPSQITVPFPWESALSGVKVPEATYIGWYRRSIQVPSGDAWQGSEAWLIIGASDFRTTVWVNGRHVTDHEGGYTPIEVHLGDDAKAGQSVDLVIRVEDRTDPQQPTGKQVYWYTTTSGIWQTVYLEARPKRFIRSYRSVADIRAGTLRVIARLNGDADGTKLRLRSPDGSFETVTASASDDQDAATLEATLHVKEPRLWSPESPHLYDLDLELIDGDGELIDSVQTYFGLREIGVDRVPGEDYQYITLNGKPIYLRGALHQAFHPEGIYQYPDDATLRGDYALARDLGLNFIRIHIKAPIPRALYWADTLGVLIMEDMPNFWKESDRAFAWYEAMAPRVIEQDTTHPSVFSWCMFNETWGFRSDGYGKKDQAFVKRMVSLARKLDPTRLVEDNSPNGRDHVETDINSWHFYINDYERARDHIQEVVERTYPGSAFNYVPGYVQDNAPLINSEYGGISSGMGDQDVSWCFKYLTNELRKYGKIGGYVYTELSDIEWEHNGFVNYDRTPKEFGYDFWFPEMTVADLNGADFVVIDAPPCVEFKPDQNPRIAVKLSHMSGRVMRTPMLRWRVDWYDALGQRTEGKWRARPAKVEPYRVVEQPPLVINIDEDGTEVFGTLLLEWLDRREPIARNYINLRVDRQSGTGWRVLDARRLACAFNPSEAAQWSFTERCERRVALAVEKLASTGSGEAVYEIELPAHIPLDEIAQLTVMAELAAKAGDEKRAWSTRPGKTNLPHYPQTDVKKTPTNVTLTINGIEVETLRLPDDPADARGALSHHRGHQGTYGYLTSFTLQGAKLIRALREARASGQITLRWTVPPSDDGQVNHGLAIFGDGLGRYPVKPTIVFTYASGHALPLSAQETE